MPGHPPNTIGSAPVRRDDISELRELLQEISWKLGRIQSGLTVDLGLTAPQATALEAIHDLGPEIDMVTLASSTNLPASSITSIVDRLADLGFVVRGRRESDRRRVTATGEITDGQLDAIDAEVKALIDGSVVKAKADPKPKAADLMSDVYVSY